jgi:hypothetical protein
MALVDFALGCIVGAGVVGASVWRTLAVYEMDYSGGLWSGIINSIAYYFSVHWIAKDNTVAYLGTAVGSTFVILFMIWKKKRKLGGGQG